MTRFVPSLLTACLLMTIGCAGPAMVSRSRPDAYFKGIALEEEASGRDSLFSSDSAVLADEDVKQILAFRFKPQSMNRIAILPIGQIYWHGWSDELDKAGQAVQTALIGKLRKAPSVFDAAYLPTLLVPEKKTIGHLREAAARFQSDLLLVYKASFRTYEKYTFFSPDKSKAYCNLEGIVLDTRTGIVPFTILVTRTFIAEQQKADMNFQETIRKAQLSALESALSEVGDEVVAFLNLAMRSQ